MNLTTNQKIVVIGGGAAGYFAAIFAAASHPDCEVMILEKSLKVLSKVRISGGGRCNVTHACFDPALLIKNYPRGHRELLGPFTRFQPKDTIAWFEARGVPLKCENDGRVFPQSDSSETIIHALEDAAKEAGVVTRLKCRVESVVKEGELFSLMLNTDENLLCRALILATGSSQDGYEIAQRLSHTLVPPVPSLFTFNIPTSSLHDLSGITLQDVEVSIQGEKLMQRGPILITHFGFSGPVILKLSAWGARILHEKQYRAEILINWAPAFEIEHTLLQLKKKGTQSLEKCNPFGFPKQLWRRFIINPQKNLAEISERELKGLSEKLKKDCYFLEGKTTHKEEFVTAGGIHLKEVNFKTMESKVCPGLFFAGEILDIDGVTGGFNFQNAWTTGWIAGNSIV